LQPYNLSNYHEAYYNHSCMKNQSEDRFNFLGRVLLMVLFLLVICAHFDKSEKQTYFATQYEILSEIHSNSAHAVCVDFIQAPVIQKSLVTLNDKSGISLFNEDLKISADNNRISKRIILFQKSLLSSLNPQSICRFYYHLFPIDTQEPPLLS
jgi:hypothetical protein